MSALTKDDHDQARGDIDPGGDFDSRGDLDPDRDVYPDGDIDPDEEAPPEPDYSSYSLTELDQGLWSLSGHMNSATYRQLAMVSELDRREPWLTMGCLSCAHYLNWRCGVALGAAREKVRTARALRGLPQIAKLFRLGRLSYSKVRALTRVATEADEQEWLEIALHGTATHVERVVRLRRQSLAAIDPQRLLDSRMCSSYWDDDGMLVIQARLTAEQGAVFRKAIDQSFDLDAAGQFGDDVDGVDGRAALRADALARVCEGFLENEGGAGHAADRYQVRVDVPAGTLMAAVEHGASADAMPILESDGPPLSLRTLRRLCCDASIVVDREMPGEVLGEALVFAGVRTRRSRTIPASLRRQLLRRDGGCRFPGCTNVRFVDAHHVQHWADGGDTVPDNLVMLCRRHHTFVHERDYRIEPCPRSRPSDPLFRFFEPVTGQALHATGDWRSRGNVEELIAWNLAEGVPC